MNSWHVPCIVKQLRCAGVLVATNRTFGLVTASQRPRRQRHCFYGFTSAAGIRLARRGAGFNTDQTGGCFWKNGKTWRRLG
jgi:hypothetical protein